MAFQFLKRLIIFDALPRHRLNDRGATEAFWQKWSASGGSERTMMILRRIILLALFFAVTLGTTFLVR